jgi:ABC-type cobalt transport system, permease component CbiQ and related transporters
MIVARDLAPAQLDSVLGRTSPVLKLVISIVWLLGLATTVAAGPPLIIALIVIPAGLTLGRIPGRDLARALAPLWLAAFGLATFNTLFGAANLDPGAAVIAQLGPFRITHVALAAGIGLGFRVAAIGAVGAVFALTTDSTRLVDSLVQQGHLPERFAYGALAAYGAVPRFSEDLATLRQARRIRGLRGDWHPRLLVSLLVLAIRHGDRMAIAMDARGFGSGPRGRYRVIRWGPLDLAIAIGAAVVLIAASAGGARLSL